MSRLLSIWRSWEPQSTWREGVIVTVVDLALIALAIEIIDIAS
jgi:hypothetical protein